MTNNIKYRPEIDGLRAIAVSFVLIFHLKPDIFPGGFVGVDVFFVISGYLIGEILLREIIINQNFSILTFYKRRILRIFPSLLIVVAFTLIFGWIVMSPREFKSLGLNVFGSSFFIQNLVLLHESGYFDLTAARKPLLHIWSLGIEEQFYIFFPFYLIFINRFRFKILTFLIFSLLASFLICLYMSKVQADAAFYLPITRAWELIIGAVLACSETSVVITKKIQRIRVFCEYVLQIIIFSKENRSAYKIFDDVISSVGLALLVVCIIKFNGNLNYPGIYAVIPVAATILLISSRGSWVNKHILSSRIFVFIGIISYPLYLWHFPIFAYKHIIFPEIHSFLMSAILVFSSFILAWGTYRFVEKPVRFGYLSGVAVIPLLGILMFIGLLGSVVFVKEGLPSRIPDELRPFVLTGEETSKHWRRGECLLLPDQDHTHFTTNCERITGKRPLILLWGDSYAAALYPGLNHLNFSKTYDLAEMTSSACPPLIGFDHPGRKYCKNNNYFIMKKIRELKPDVIVLHSTWSYHIQDLERGLKETINKLNDENIRHVYLLGPVPAWSGDGLSSNFIDYYFTHAHNLLPARTKFRLDDHAQDRVLAEVASKVGISYISAWSYFCNSDGCLARLGDSGQYLSAFDGGHLTLEGSTFLAKEILPVLQSNWK